MTTGEKIDQILNKLHISKSGAEVIGKKPVKREIIEWRRQEMKAMLDRLYNANDHLDPSKIITAIDKERSLLRKMK